METILRFIFGEGWLILLLMTVLLVCLIMALLGIADEKLRRRSGR